MRLDEPGHANAPVPSVDLHHRRLPLLADGDFVDWDESQDRVDRGPAFEEIEPLLEHVLAEHPVGLALHPLNAPELTFFLRINSSRVDDYRESSLDSQPWVTLDGARLVRRKLACPGWLGQSGTPLYGSRQGDK